MCAIRAWRHANPAPEIAEQVNKEKPVVEKTEETADAAPTFIRLAVVRIARHSYFHAGRAPQVTSHHSTHQS